MLLWWSWTSQIRLFFLVSFVLFVNWVLPATLVGIAFRWRISRWKNFVILLNFSVGIAYRLLPWSLFLQLTFKLYLLRLIVVLNSDQANRYVIGLGAWLVMRSQDGRLLWLRLQIGFVAMPLQIVLLSTNSTYINLVINNVAASHHLMPMVVPTRIPSSWSVRLLSILRSTYWVMRRLTKLVTVTSWLVGGRTVSIQIWWCLLS